MVSTRKALAAFTATGLGALAYAHFETRRFTLRRIEIPILPQVKIHFVYSTFQIYT